MKDGTINHMDKSFHKYEVNSQYSQEKPSSFDMIYTPLKDKIKSPQKQSL